MLLLPLLFFAILHISTAYVKFPFTQVFQGPDLASTNKTDIMCAWSCTVYTDSTSDKLIVTLNGEFIVDFKTIGMTNNGYFLPAPNSGDYMLENRGEMNPQFVFYNVDIYADSYGSPVSTLTNAQQILRSDVKDRFHTIISSLGSFMVSEFTGSFKDGYPRIYPTGYDVIRPYGPSDDYGCTPVYQARSQKNAETSSLTIATAMITIDYGYVGDHSAEVHYGGLAEPKASIGASVVFTSPGYIGCRYTDGVKCSRQGGTCNNYYSPISQVEESFTLAADGVDINATLAQLSPDEPLMFTLNGKTANLDGSSSFAVHKNDQYFDIALSWRRQTATSYFAMQLDFGGVAKTTTTKKTSPTTQYSSTTRSPSTTTTQQPHAADDSHCGCAVDKFGYPNGWDSRDLWLDVVIVLDTSEAMADSLADATELVDSIIGNGNFDVLITDPRAPFYTRVGVIAMSDSAQVLYNLNMTKYDSVTDKVQVKKGVKQIDLMEAFASAQTMFADGIKSNPDRANTRQVIYYLTDSDGTVNPTLLDQFKHQGTIIVNRFVKVGESESAGLKQLASDGYYFTDIRENYMLSVQVFCKANCFCLPDRTPYRGQSEDAAVVADGGCYYERSSGVPFSKAVSTCFDNRGGLLASVHSQQKGAFLNELITNATHKNYYFWIGYSKGDDGQWKWEDKSTEGYTNWDVDEPTDADVVKCAYVDQNQQNLPWGAGNCNLGLPYVCDYAPCSVGNKNC